MPETERYENASVPDYCKLSLQKGGVAIAVTVPDVINCSGARARCVDQLVDLVAREIPVAVRPAGFAATESALLLAFCRMLSDGFRRAGLDTAALELTVDAAVVPPDAALYLARCRLGAGILNVLAGPAELARWQSWLWRTRLDPRRRVGLWPAVQSACSLLTVEPATEILPGTALQVPAQSAWWTVHVPLDLFLDRHGRFDTVALEHSLCDVLDATVHLHDTSTWATPAMQQDAWLNRRVAIRLTGVGDLVRALGLDPGEHRTLKDLAACFAALRTSLVQHSMRMARKSETLPAIAAGSPASAARGRAPCSEWQQRWVRAVHDAATYHRNLIAMSPFDVFPRDSADLRYANLLPLMEYADVCAADAQPSLARWNAATYAGFHARVHAMHAALCTDYVVAEQR